LESLRKVEAVMEEWMNNPQPWINSVISATIALALAQLYRLARGKIQPLLVGAKGSIRSFFRGRKLKDLKRIKAARFDSIRINREIVLSYTMLAFFILAAVLCVGSFGFAPAEAYKNHIAAMIYGSITGIPLLIFEFAWLITSTRVDEMLKYRSRIKRRGRTLF
jgi:hypothetical protein